MKDAVSILAIGSELLNGQILNRNAQWLSQRLNDFGFEVVQHMTVDDKNEDIIAALKALAQHSSYLFVTGGLGPTTDDLTRDAVASWAGKEMVYDPASWTHIQEIFERFHRPAPETNKQQCFFPDGSTVLRNQAGTANGFSLMAHNIRVFVLPGPPREVEVIWNDHIASDLALAVPEDQKRITKMWRTIGLGESNVAELLNPLFIGKTVSVAYRAHAPYVETKVSFPKFASDTHKQLIDLVGATLKKWLFEVDQEDVVLALAQELNRFSTLDIYDGASQGHLSQFLAPHIKTTAKLAKQASLVTSWEEHDDPRQFIEQCFAVSGSSEMTLAVAGFAPDGKWALGVRAPGIQEVIVRESPYFGEALRSRNQMAVAALAIKGWLDLIGRNVN